MEKPLLLIVDDEPGSRYGIKKALSQFRFAIQEAGDGKEALDKIQQLLPDLVSLADLPVCSSADFSVHRSQRQS